MYIATPTQGGTQKLNSIWIQKSQKSTIKFQILTLEIINYQHVKCKYLIDEIQYQMIKIYTYCSLEYIQK